MVEATGSCAEGWSAKMSNAPLFTLRHASATRAKSRPFWFTGMLTVAVTLVGFPAYAADTIILRCDLSGTGGSSANNSWNKFDMGELFFRIDPVAPALKIYKPDGSLGDLRWVSDFPNIVPVLTVSSTAISYYWEHPEPPPYVRGFNNVQINRITGEILYLSGEGQYDDIVQHGTCVKVTAFIPPRPKF